MLKRYQAKAHPKGLLLDGTIHSWNQASAGLSKAGIDAKLIRGQGFVGKWGSVSYKGL